MSTLRSVLEEIQTGRTRFSPISNADKDMSDFQPIAKILVYANNQGFLERCVPHQENQISNNWYDLILVKGGLSYDGASFLVSPRVNDVEETLDDIIQLKPSIYGVGIDLKALWKKWKKGTVT